MYTLRSEAKRALILLLAVVSVVIFSQSTIVSALPQAQKKTFRDGAYYFDIMKSTVCNTGGAASAGESTGSNMDYAGNPILNKTQLASITENQPTYEQAASEADIPWQLIAVVHLRESGLGRENPGNGQGIYQFVSGLGGPYPSGPVNDAEFLRQTKLAASFLKDKAAGANLSPNRTLGTDADPEAVKDTLFSYNGRSGQYADQAAALGYDKATQPYEGSPYVMNKADAKRDPAVNKTTWGQVKRDFGPIEYPANDGYGAFVIYGAIAGVSSNCSGSVREKIVTLAKQELELWKNGQLKPGTDFHKYSQGRNENWCADFVSWIYNQAGYPLDDTEEGNVRARERIHDIGLEGNGAGDSAKFHFHANDGSYTPKTGDIVIQHLELPGDDISHVNIVTAVNGSTITVIGGNQHGRNSLPGEYYQRSSVTEYDMAINTPENVGFVSPD